MPQSELYKTLQERGFIHQCTDEAALDAQLNKEATTAYIGFDCTAKSLHVGSLVQIMMLRWLQKCGHKPIVLMGGGTTKIGDPSGKDSSRPQLTDADIQANMDGIKTVFEKFLSFGNAATDAVMVNNDDWLQGINYISFLREYGSEISVNRMLSRDSVKIRLEKESHLSFLEFNYMILQAYDFVELYRRYNVRLQLGGSDQWGNIVEGILLHRRANAKLPSLDAPVKDKSLLNCYDEVFGLTTPLLTTASGAKMGKTADGAIWLNADMCSPYDYWQFWRNTEDADVVKFLKLFTELSMEEIAKLEALEGADINEAKKVLATEATTLLHGAEAAKLAEETARKTFEQGGTAATLPEVKVPAAELEAGVPAFKLFHMAELAKSGGEARRLIKGGGAKVNDAPVKAEDEIISNSAMTDEGFIKLSAGKKRHVLVKAV